jgi:(p)ppGpp synthase/HD superfamily hydrolase
MFLSLKFSEAVQYAAEVHKTQKRKGTDIPYIAHLLAVASIALEYGANENEAIAALLHDAPEDAGGQDRLEEIRQQFGDIVADIVQDCSDTFDIPKPPWKKRKKDYIESIARKSSSSRFVSAADKLHNSRSILFDYRTIGDALWPRFATGKVDVLWYYRSLVKAYGEGGSFRRQGFGDLLKDLNDVVSEIHRLTALNPVISGEAI